MFLVSTGLKKMYRLYRTVYYDQDIKKKKW